MQLLSLKSYVKVKNLIFSNMYDTYHTASKKSFARSYNTYKKSLGWFPGIFYIQLKYCSKSSLSSSYLNNFPWECSLASTQFTIFSDTSFQYIFFFFIFLLDIAHCTISAIRDELMGGAIILAHSSIVSVRSEPNLIVTHGVSTIFASSCIDPESVTTAHAFEIISITSWWWAKALPYAKLLGYFLTSCSISFLRPKLSIANSLAYNHKKQT